MGRVESDANQGSSATGQLFASPWVSWIGFRYLLSKKNSKFLSLITAISIVGVALGVTAMIVVLSVMDGFENELKKRLTSTDLHILVTPQPTSPGYQQGFVRVDDPEVTATQSRISAHPEVESVFPIVTTEAILRMGRKVVGVSLKGVGPERLDKLKRQMGEMAEPGMLIDRDGPNSQKLPSIFIGQEMAYELSAVPGDRVTLISPTETDGPLSSVPRMRRYVIEGIYRSGIPEQELHVVFASDQSVRSFLRRPDAINSWEVVVREFDRAAAVGTAIKETNPAWRVQDWVALNSHLFYSLRLERLAMTVILAVIVLVASFNIVTTLTMMVLEKKRDISILKAMGARHSQVAAIFLSEGLFIGALGVGGGLALGGLICLMLKRYEFIQLPEIYYDRTLPVAFEPFYYVCVGLIAVTIVLGACVYPSKRASRLDPIEGIRFG